MMRLEVSVDFADGTSQVLPNPERDDPAGRQMTERIAWAFLAKPEVSGVLVRKTMRTASGRKGTYR